MYIEFVINNYYLEVFEMKHRPLDVYGTFPLPGLYL